MTFTNTRVSDLAKNAADEYLNNGGNLNLAIAKLAKENELTPMQIQRVVESANHEVFARQYKVATDKRFVFDLASLNGVLDLLGTSGTDKTASDASNRDFFVLDRDRRYQSATKTAAQAEKQASFHVRLNGDDAGRAAALHTLNRCYSQLTTYARDMRVEKQAADLSRHENFDKFVKEAQRLMLEENIPFRFMFGGAGNQIHQELRNAIFAEAHARLTKNANAVEKSLLAEFDPKASKELGMEIVNGNQPLFIHLRATAGDATRSHCMGILCEAVNRCLSGVVTAIHNLKTNEDVKRYVEQEIQPFAYNVQRGIKYAMQYVYENADSQTWLAKTADWRGVASLLDKIGRLFHLLNHGSQSVELAGRGVSQYLQDLLSPVVVRGGNIINTSGSRS